MKQLPIILFCALGFSLLAGAVRATTTVIDNFDSYTNASYIQAQNSAWTRSGTALTDGIYSIAGGASGRGANYSMDWSLGNASRVKYTFASTQVFTPGVTFSVDLKTSVSLADTLGYAIITDNTGTTWQTTLGQSVTNTAAYSTYSFSFTADTTTLTSGTSALVTALANTQSITFQFVNVDGASAGTQTISFDNVTVTTSAIPEPGSVALIMAGVSGMLSMGVVIRRRRASC